MKTIDIESKILSENDTRRMAWLRVHSVTLFSKDVYIINGSHTMKNMWTIVNLINDSGRWRFKGNSDYKLLRNSIDEFLQSDFTNMCVLIQIQIKDNTLFYSDKDSLLISYFQPKTRDKCH